MELTIEEIISLFNERELNYKTNNYLVTDLDSLVRQKIINGIEKEIIIKRYGLFDNDEFTQKEISEYLNISRSYVSRIEKRAITKLFREFKRDGGEF